MRTVRRGTRLARPLVALVAVALLAAGCTGDAPADEGGTTGEALSLDTGTGPLPEEEFGLLEDPEVTVSTTDWVGTPTVINFWATWCTFCVEEMPALQAASERLDGLVRFVGIDQQDPLDAARAFVEETGVTYLNVVSPSGEYYSRIGARGMPTTLFVDADGVVAYRHTGPLTEEQVYELVGEHLGVVAGA